MRTLLAEQGLTEQYHLDSAGTAGWHVGKAPDARAIQAAAKRGIDLSSLRARQVTEADFARFDYLLAMDSSNYDDLLAMRPANTRAQIERLLHFAPAGWPLDVPDPYYGGDDGFEHVLDLITEASRGFFAHIQTDGGAISE
jgi:protein-tyrosine phosphatase